MPGWSIPGVLLDDVYRLLGDRRPDGVALEVVALEPDGGAVRVRYRLVGADGRPLADGAGEPLGLVGLTDAAPDDLRPGVRLRVPGRDEVGTPI
jgi:hypothetical protein